MRLSDKLAAAGGRPSGFDYLRLGLALGVFLLHSTETSYGQLAQHLFWYTPLMPLAKALVPAFFALSGFLVAGSLQRTNTLFMFIGLRAIRIYPALIVDIFFSALILGAFLTTLPLGEYFHHPQFFRYLLNVSGEISFVLPGVLDGNPVNSQLWTIPFELYCYASLAILVLLGIRSRPSSILYFICVSVVGAIAYAIYRHHARFYLIEQSVPGFSLLTAFSTGVAMYLYRDRIAWNPFWTAAAGVTTYLIFMFIPGSDFVAVIPTAYLTVMLGLYDPRRIGLIRTADYSYGIYLYHLPLQLTLIHVFPALYPWYLAIPVELAVTGLFAAFSWHVVERPALRLRSKLRSAEERFFPRSRRKPPGDAIHVASAAIEATSGDVSAHRPPSREIPT